MFFYLIKFDYLLNLLTYLPIKFIYINSKLFILYFLLYIKL